MIIFYRFCPTFYQIFDHFLFHFLPIFVQFLSDFCPISTKTKNKSPKNIAQKYSNNVIEISKNGTIKREKRSKLRDKKIASSLGYTFLLIYTTLSITPLNLLPRSRSRKRKKNGRNLANRCIRRKIEQLYFPALLEVGWPIYVFLTQKFDKNGEQIKSKNRAKWS